MSETRVSGDIAMGVLHGTEDISLHGRSVSYQKKGQMMGLP